MMILEYLGKGLTLGILFVLGLGPDWKPTPPLLVSTLLGIVLALGLAARHSIRNGAKPRNGYASFFFFIILDNPILVYLGVLGGLLFGAIANLFLFESWTWNKLILAVGIGLGLGVAMLGLRRITHTYFRRGTVLLALAGLAWATLSFLPVEDPQGFRILGIHLIIAVGLLYFLTFAGQTEETELEIGLACLLLGIALWTVVPSTVQLLAIVVPVVIYLCYTHFLLSDMESFKSLLRGLSHIQRGATVPAMTEFHRVLQLSPRSRPAREALWRVHRQIDLREVHADPRLLRLIDFGMCLQRAKELLFADQVSAEVIAEAKQLLDLVADQRPSQIPEVLYYRTVAHAHAREFDKAQASLTQLLDASQIGPDQEASRQKVLLAGWQLALTQHSELKKCVGEPLLSQGRRMDAIAAVEQTTRRGELDQAAQELKKTLYEGLTTADYQKEAGAALLQQASHFDHKYLYEMGLDMLEEPGRWQRGAELLRIALRGQIRHAPAVLKLIAQAAAQHGDRPSELAALAEVKSWAKTLNFAEMSPESQAAYFATVRQLGEAAYRDGRIDEALENLLLCLDDPQSGSDTLRMVADLYEKKGDVLATLHYNEQCLLYDAKNPVYVERRDRVLISLSPEMIVQHQDKAAKLIDQAYLIAKARQLLDLKNAGADQYQWACHIAELLTTLAPERVAGWALKGRALLRLGQPGPAVQSLEQGYALGKASKPAGEDLEGWYLISRILGDHYFQAEQYAQALDCFTTFQKSTKSGAETLYKMGQASERLGQIPQARKHYESANMFDHPNKYEVGQALERLAVKKS